MSMTKVEQYLTYVNREIVHMSKDHIGGITYVHYADRVISDVCGIEGFATATLGSAKPMAVILGALRGSKGTVVMKFFDEQLHDARGELVLLLVEATKLSRLGGRSNRESYSYLKRLYNSSVKKMIKLVDGKEKRKDRIGGKYPALSALSNFGYENDDYGFFSSEYDDDDGYEESSDYQNYADAALEALRNGEEPPKPFAGMGADNPMPFDLNVDNDILQLLTRIQNRIGRKLNPAEMLEIIQKASEDDEEPEPILQPPSSPEIPLMDPKMLQMMECIANMVVEKINMGGEAPETDEIHTTNDLDEFIAQSEEVMKKDEDPEEEPEIGNQSVMIGSIPEPVEESKSLPPSEPKKEPETKDLIAVLNGVKSDSVPVEEPQSDPAPPVDETGGESNGLESVYYTLVGLDASDLYSSNSHYMAEMEGYLQTCTATLLNNIVKLTPSIHDGYLIDVTVYTIIQGAIDQVNSIYVNTINSRMCEGLSKELSIDSNLMYLTSYVHEIDSVSFEEHKERFFEDAEIDRRRQMDKFITAIAIYLYKVSTVIPDVRFISDASSKQVAIWVGPKMDFDNPPPALILDMLRNAAADLVNKFGKISAIKDYHIRVTPFGWDADDRDEVFNPILQKHLISESVPTYSFYMAQLAAICEEELKHRLSLYNIVKEKIEAHHTVDFAEGKNKVSIEIFYSVKYPEGALDVDDATEFKTDFEGMYAAGIGMQLLLGEISSSIEVNAYLRLVEEPEEAEPEEVEESEDSSKTNAFGL